MSASDGDQVGTASEVGCGGRLLQTFWGLPTDAQHNVLNTCIYSLRGKFDSHGAPHRIHTVRGVGFSLQTVTPDDTAG
ncbi:hypothetical protein Rhow_001216 [Rhodococcus wratislaviensis]|uniref:OmpR/PhoB-type domain-containing protein n=1 Tax=Rhodococcus wratislaviensis TaxID=44752 RepID=A0A402C3M5_RHOWR|nr:helix-turn-helix domain-containing protein [Rhodococcus wratislaviensis]GCE38177.1 hypothetical protein Rhow_001216 [Rhodococcus wratislaviensis]